MRRTLSCLGQVGKGVVGFVLTKIPFPAPNKQIRVIERFQTVLRIERLSDGAERRCCAWVLRVFKVREAYVETGPERFERTIDFKEKQKIRCRTGRSTP